MTLRCIDPLLTLALQASEDLDACPVLGDFLLENECPSEVWVETRQLILRNTTRHWSERYSKANSTSVSEYVAMNGATPTPTFARALASVLLFAAFQETPWPRRLKLYDTVQVYLNGQLLQEPPQVRIDGVSYDRETGRISAQIPGAYLPIAWPPR